MTTPQEPSAPLTRRQLRELRETGQLPVILDGEVASVTEPPAAADAAVEAPSPAPVIADPPPAVEEEHHAFSRRRDRAAAEVTAAPQTDGKEKEAPAEQVLPGLGVPASRGEVSPPRSFDELLEDTSTSGSTFSPSALIVSDPPAMLTAPVTSTGEILVTGSFVLEEVGSQGHASGVADGKDVDLVLIDGELPPQSAAVPIAATAAVSQASTPGDIITPPAPDKSNRLMMILAITAGALAVALAAVLVTAFVTGAL